MNRNHSQTCQAHSVINRYLTNLVFLNYGSINKLDEKKVQKEYKQI